MALMIMINSVKKLCCGGFLHFPFLLKGYRDFQQKMSLWSVHIRYGLLAMPKSFARCKKTLALLATRHVFPNMSRNDVHKM